MAMLISRCVWHPRNYGHGKLLGVARWRGRGVGLVDGLCDRCAQRIHPAVRPQVIRGSAVPGRGSTLGIAAVIIAVMTALLLMARPTSNLPLRHGPDSSVRQVPHEPAPRQVSHEPAPMVSLPPEPSPFRPGPPHRLASREASRPSRLVPAAHRGSVTSAGKVSRARAARGPAGSGSLTGTGRVYYQSP
jgi:hypothetical protein